MLYIKPLSSIEFLPILQFQAVIRPELSEIDGTRETCATLGTFDWFTLADCQRLRIADSPSAVPAAHLQRRSLRSDETHRLSVKVAIAITDNYNLQTHL